MCVAVGCYITTLYPYNQPHNYAAGLPSSSPPRAHSFQAADRSAEFLHCSHVYDVLLWPQAVR